ncbi:MAG: heparan-alpha-glucosaminide N-acetyltransferase [Candidatus Acetothermia bacterium]
MDKGRFPEIDLVRGLAIVGMVAYHVVFDLVLVDLVELSLSVRWFDFLGKTTAGTFFVVAGTSLYISYLRGRRVKDSGTELFGKYLLRGVKLLTWGFIISGLTYLFFPDAVIVFGALHFIGVSVFLGYLLLRFTYGLRRIYRLTAWVGIAVLIFVLSGPVKGLSVDYGYLLPLGSVPPGYQSLDYYPLLPWFGFVIGGLVLGDLFYPEGERASEVYEFKNRPVEFLGRNSLWIYFLHQPIILLGLFLFFTITGAGSRVYLPFDFLSGFLSG